MIHTRRDAAIEREILPALAEYAGDCDVEAIASEVLARVQPVDSHGQEVLTEGCTGWVVRDDVDFWEVVARHDLGGALDEAAARLARVEAEAAAARDALYAAICASISDGMTKSEAARRSGISRVTIDRILDQE